MRWNVRSVLAMLVAAWATSSPTAQAQAQTQSGAPPAPAAKGGSPPAKKAAAPPVDPTGQKMTWLLDQWAGQSTKLTSLDVAIARVDSSPAWGDDEHFVGQALFKAPNLACIDFRKVEGDPKAPDRKLVPNERIICTGSEVWQYRSDLKQVFVFPLERDVQQRALAQGPLPFLFNFRAEDARKRYVMKLIAETKGSYIIAIKPLLEIDRDAFSRAQVQLDHSFLLPTRITLVSPNEKDTKDFVLSKVKPNAAVNPENFVGKELGPPWKVVRNPVDGPSPSSAAKPPAPAAPRVGAQPRPQPPAGRPADPARLR